jgi:hypothetical protein
VQSVVVFFILCKVQTQSGSKVLQYEVQSRDGNLLHLVGRRINLKLVS